MRTQIRKKEWSPAREIMPLILGKELGDDLSEKEISKLELFEAGLKNGIKKDDTIEAAVTKIVKLALAAEFGPSLVKAQGAAQMVATITRAIMGDAKLRKQALIIIDRLSNE
ncbi:hypothetical protein A2625_05875 [candidate division WOR-1 bacterium RIFCSPHIGHO2_01_FULL_53_15]|uniref:Uncharacterized protein n=1 Tax=candidate division WOR-1 bacterium RIFCSPHIGHO2_01_FULL_53_15 TaxID=1802564 RepID=A0A1F4Q0S7_UNCSA|nr:MAG: hypothetical protein A2625_05875 [candidate division WOR-1 bacterium RIFCSPHIGHO2_01_FULL_53_15]OGC13877.1 MAG: hypothetical protein A3D23_02345 [candidate division WOR-1 bacterium RIFCSPHIGHO2_02_FULL_53_26]